MELFVSPTFYHALNLPTLISGPHGYTYSQLYEQYDIYVYICDIYMYFVQNQDGGIGYGHV